MATEFIISSAHASTQMTRYEWNFVDRGKLTVASKYTGARIGDLQYGCPVYEMGAALKVADDWVFALEKMRPEFLQPNDPKDTWFIVAFRGSTHHTFAGLAENDELVKNFLQFVITRYWSLLYPDDYTDNDIKSPKGGKLQFEHEIEDGD